MRKFSLIIKNDAGCKSFLLLPLIALITITVTAQKPKTIKDETSTSQPELRINETTPGKILLPDHLQKIKNKKSQTTAVPEGKASQPIIVYEHSDPALKNTTATTYTFTGKGQWADAGNWMNGMVPPNTLGAGSSIIIDGTGPCLFNNSKLFVLQQGSSIEIRKGKLMYLSMGNNFILQGGQVNNNGKLVLLSGTLSHGAGLPTAIINNGEIKTTPFSKWQDKEEVSTSH